MKIITGSTGTPHVTSNNAGELNQAIFGDGNIVFDIGDALEATLVDNNNITISDGNLMIQGRHALIEPGFTENVEIDTGALGVNRHDLIVARYELDGDTGYESITLQVIKGTESSGEASDPTYNTGDIRTGSTVVDFPLYRVEIEGINIVNIESLFEVVSPLGDRSTNLSAIAPIEDGTTASQSYAVGEYFVKEGNFCKCISAISSGSTFTLNTNYTITTVGTQLASTNTSVSKRLNVTQSVAYLRGDSNWDNFKTPGLYFVNTHDGSGGQGAFPVQAMGQLLIMNDDIQISQIFFSSHAFGYRAYTSGAWGTWKKVSLS